MFRRQQQHQQLRPHVGYFSELQPAAGVAGARQRGGFASSRTPERICSWLQKRWVCAFAPACGPLADVGTIGQQEKLRRMVWSRKARPLAGLVPLFLGGVHLARGVERESATTNCFFARDLCPHEEGRTVRPAHSGGIGNLLRWEVLARLAALSVALPLDRHGENPRAPDCGSIVSIHALWWP